jgi:hypothetical protein
MGNTGKVTKVRVDIGLRPGMERLLWGPEWDGGGPNSSVNLGLCV